MGTLEVRITQVGSSLGGDTVHVLLMQDHHQLFDPLEDVTITVVPDQLANGTATLRVPPGSYVVRAFRDMDGDGLPSNNPRPDPQAPGTDVTVSQGSTQVDIILADHDAYSWFVSTFLVSTNHDPDSYGSCGGFGLGMLAILPYDPPLSSPLRVKMPTNTVVELVTETECGKLNKGWYGAGVKSPGPEYAGRYVLAHRVEETDLIFMMEDNLPEIIDLGEGSVATHPTGARAVTEAFPTFSWTQVERANRYLLHVYNPDWSYHGGTNTDGLTSVLPVALQEGHVYRVGIGAGVDRDPDPNRYHPAAQTYNAPKLSFVVSSDPSAVVTIHGRIVNNTGVHGKVLVRGTGCSQGPAPCDPEQASILMDDTAVDYTLTVFKSASAGTGQVNASLTLPGGYALYGNLNGLDTTADVTGADIKLVKTPVLISPVYGATNTGPTPTFEWEDYSVTPGPTPAVYSYVLLAFRVGEFLPAFLWGLPPTVTSYDLAHPPLDRIDLYSRWALQSGDDLSSGGPWYWAIQVTDCDFTNPDGSYLDCATSAVFGGNPPAAWSYLDTGLPSLSKPVLVSPSNQSVDVSTRPVFRWVDYARSEPNPPAGFSYMLFVSPAEGDYDCISWGLPGNATSFDMAAPPVESFDLCGVLWGGQSGRELQPARDWKWWIGILPCEYNNADSAYRECVDREARRWGEMLRTEFSFTTAGGGSSSSGSSTSGTSSSCGGTPQSGPCTFTSECECGLECRGGMCVPSSSSGSTSSTSTDSSTTSGGWDGGTEPYDAGDEPWPRDGGTEWPDAGSSSSGFTLTTILHIKNLIESDDNCRWHTQSCPYNVTPTYAVRLENVVATSNVYSDWDNKAPGPDGGLVPQWSFFVAEAFMSSANQGVVVVAPPDLDVPEVRAGDLLTVEGILRVNYGNTFIRLAGLTVVQTGTGDNSVAFPVTVEEVANNVTGAEGPDGGCKSWNQDTSLAGEKWEGALVEVDVGAGLPVTYVPNQRRFSLDHRIGVTDYFHVLEQVGTSDAGYTMTTNKKVIRLRGFGYYGFGCRKIVPRSPEDLVIQDL